MSDEFGINVPMSDCQGEHLDIERLRQIADIKESRWKKSLVVPFIGKCFHLRAGHTAVVLGRSPWSDSYGERIFIGIIFSAIPTQCHWFSHGGYFRDKVKHEYDLVECVENSGHNGKLEYADMEALK